MGKKKTTNTIRIVVKVTAFLLIFFLLFQSATYIFRTKELAFSVGPIYNLPDNSVDVLFLGSSHMNTAISPMDMWNNYGITSFNAAIGDQTIPASYFELRELLKVQKPKVVVLETYHIFQSEMMTSSGEARLHWLVDNIPMSRGVSEAIQTLIGEESRKTEYYLNFYTFHNRWKELTKEDFKPVESYNAGADMSIYGVHEAMERPAIIPREETTPVPKLPEEYLYQIIELCKTENISLMLMASPFCAGEWIQTQLNYLDRIAEENNVPYLNFLYLLDDIQFDFSKDMAEWSHMNYYGVQKVTSYLGAFLKERYQLTDHRSEPETASLWNEKYEVYERILCNARLKTARDLESYFNCINQGNYIVLWSGYSESASTGINLQKILSMCGLSVKETDQAYFYCALTQSGQCLYEIVSSERIQGEYMINDTLFSFGPGVVESQNSIAVHVGRTEYSEGSKDLNVAVFDPFTNKVVDSININLTEMTLSRQ